MSLARPVSVLGAGGVEPLFPNESGGGLALSQARLKELSRSYSALYLALLAELTDVLSRELSAPSRAVELVLREALVSPLHAFLDRLLRLEELSRGKPDLRVAAAPPARDCDDAAELRADAQSSAAFNAGLLAEHAGLLGLTLSSVSAPEESSPAVPPSGRNSNFDGETIFSKLRRRALDLLPRRAGRLPCHSLAYSTAALREAGFLRRRLESIAGRFVPAPAARDAALRATLARRVSSSAAVDAFLDAAGFARPELKPRVREALGLWLARQCPSVYLEGLTANLERARAVLAPFAPRPFVLSEVSSIEVTILMAAARTLNMPVVGLQHGGHYGYIEDHTLALDLEYSFYDRFVSWGWTDMPDWEVCRRVAVTALPCPWLEQRRVHWAREVPQADRDPRGKPHDLLLLTNKLYRFPPAPSGAAVCRSDRAPELGALLETLAGEAASHGLTILHRPYNAQTRSLLAGAFAAMARRAGARYQELPAVGKGLTAELVRACGVVVWEQPGTGFLECLAAGLPTLCLWPRLYNEEEPRWSALFAELEAAGLVHLTPASLCDEIVRFKADPPGWTAEPRRRAAGASFSRLFGRAEPGWAAEWDRFLKELSC